MCIIPNMNYVCAVLMLTIGFVGLARAEDKPKFELISSAFKHDEDIPEKYTCRGGDINPPVEFKNIPAKTKTLALTVHDPDAPEGTWVHWVVYNIPPTKGEVAENSTPGYQALNDFGKYNYSGPCPSDEKQHHYVFRAYAVDTILLINEGMTMKDLEKAMSGHVVAKSELIGLYRKPIW
jgi:Raf kinase inhibitor-like YbhB/YbcL family protein